MYANMYRSAPDKLNMVDFHSHILPNMDDGSSGIEESLAMLREQQRQGCDVVFPPHTSMRMTKTRHRFSGAGRKHTRAFWRRWRAKHCPKYTLVRRYCIFQA